MTVVETSAGGVPLYGLQLPAGGEAVAIAVHGTASNFYENTFYWPIAAALARKGVSFLAVNTRGADVLQAYPLKGAALERFEDCVEDIDAWVEFALARGYRRVLLIGHSLGSEKCVYYLNRGRLRKQVSGLILLAPSASYHYHLAHEPDHARLLAEARTLVKEGKGGQFLTTRWLCYGRRMPKGAASYRNFLEKGSALCEALPFPEGKLLLYKNISIPVLVVIGDNDRKEYTVIPIAQALTLLRKENPRTVCRQIRGADHDFTGKEKELSRYVTSFAASIIV